MSLLPPACVLSLLLPDGALLLPPASALLRACMPLLAGGALLLPPAGMLLLLPPASTLPPACMLLLPAACKQGITYCLGGTFIR
jgi:hypothetical protein